MKSPTSSLYRAAGGGFFVYMAVLHKGTVQSVESLQIDNGVPRIL
jgi:hypothetical protein